MDVAVFVHMSESVPFVVLCLYVGLTAGNRGSLRLLEHGIHPECPALLEAGPSLLVLTDWEMKIKGD